MYKSQDIGGPMDYKPQVGDRVRATPISVTTLPAEAFQPGGLQSTVEGEVVSVNEKKGTIVVRDAGGDQVECYAAAFPLVGSVIVAVPTGRPDTAAWVAHIKGRESPICYDNTKDRAVEKMRVNFPSLLTEPVTVE